MSIVRIITWVFRIIFSIIAGAVLFCFFIILLLLSKVGPNSLVSPHDYVSALKTLLYISTIILLSCFVLFVLFGIYKISNPSGSISRKQTTALILVTGVCACCLVYYAIKRGVLFDGPGELPRCVAWDSTQYKDIPCHYSVHPEYGTKVVHVTKKNISILNLKRISVNDNTSFFEPVKGTPIVYYYQDDSKIEFFNSEGVHPISGKQLLPVTPNIIKKYFQQAGKLQKSIETEQKDLAIKEALIELEKQRKLETIKPYDSYIEINGVIWAPKNIGANTEDESGSYFNFYDAKNVCPGNWRLPTEKEWEDLISHEYKFAANGVDFGVGDNHLFLPYIKRDRDKYYNYKLSDTLHSYGEYCGSTQRDQVFSVISLSFHSIVAFNEGRYFIHDRNSEERDDSMRIAFRYNKYVDTLCAVRCVLRQ